MRTGRCSICHELTELNRRGICYKCSGKRMIQAIRQLRTKRGRFYRLWKAHYEAARALRARKKGS
jgi:hypothetical protein